MRAFLSHSSKDKHIVEDVAKQLGGANIELDSLTFEQGVPNSAAIQSALKRSGLFVLFLSADAIQSDFVKFETLKAQELAAAGVLERILIICLDDQIFAKLDESLKSINVVRKVTSVQSITRLIQHQLVVSARLDSTKGKPFVGRQAQLNEAKNQLIDPTRKDISSLYVSGNAGIGRRTFTRKLFSEAFPYTNPIFPEIFIDPIDGPDEIYRKLIEVHTPVNTRAALRAYITGFAAMTPAGKIAEIGALLSRIVEGREAIFFVDRGGLLEDSGRLTEPLRDVQIHLPIYPHPAAIYVAERRIPPAYRDDLRNCVFCSVPALSREESRQLIALSLRANGISYDAEELEQVTDLSDLHPFNIEIIVASAKQYTLPILLADTRELAHWKHKRGAEFLRRVKFSDGEVVVLAALRDLRTLDFSTLTSLLSSDGSQASAALIKLMDFHITETTGDAYLLAPALRSAVERDPRFKLDPSSYRKMLNTVSEALTTSGEDESITVSMIDAAILANLQNDLPIPEAFSAFLLPSHQVWLARRLYDRKDYSGCIATANRALEGKARLSKAGLVEACRVLCLSSARLKRDQQFKEGIATLEQISTENWTKSNLHFLLGFAARMKGFLHDAEREYRKSLDFSPGNHSAIRDLADVCLALGDIDSAELYARKAYDVGPDNPYFIDILLTVLLNQTPAKRMRSQDEIDLLFSKLREFGEDEDSSFFTTRRAEFELRNGNAREAERLIDVAVTHTPHIFGVHALRAKIYLSRGNKAIVSEEIGILQKMLDDVNSTQGKGGLHDFLGIKAEYLVACADFSGAKRIYEAKGIFTEEEKIKAIRDIDFEQARNKR